MQRLSVSPVQTAMEASLQLAFEDAVILSRHAGRATVMSDDWWTGLELRSMRGDDPLLNGLQRRSLFISLYFIYVSTLSFCCLCALVTVKAQNSNIVQDFFKKGDIAILSDFSCDLVG